MEERLAAQVHAVAVDEDTMSMCRRDLGERGAQRRGGLALERRELEIVIALVAQDPPHRLWWHRPQVPS